MVEVATVLEREQLPANGEKTRLLTLDHLDGRTLAVREVKRFEREIAADLGGIDTLSEAQKALARRAAVLSAVLEDAEARWAGGQPLGLASYVSAANTLRRLLTTLGLERRAKTVNGLERFAEAD